MARLSVLIADGNPVVRAGLAAILGAAEDLDVIAQAADGREALSLTRLHAPDVILLDVRMPGVDGISALPHLVQLAPVLMLTYSREAEIICEALSLGAAWLPRTRRVHGGRPGEGGTRRPAGPPPLHPDGGECPPRGTPGLFASATRCGTVF